MNKPVSAMMVMGSRQSTIVCGRVSAANGRTRKMLFRDTNSSAFELEIRGHARENEALLTPDTASVPFGGEVVARHHFKLGGSSRRYTFLEYARHWPEREVGQWQENLVESRTGKKSRSIELIRNLNEKARISEVCDLSDLLLLPALTWPALLAPDQDTVAAIRGICLHVWHIVAAACACSSSIGYFRLSSAPAGTPPLPNGAVPSLHPRKAPTLYRKLEALRSPWRATYLEFECRGVGIVEQRFLGTSSESHLHSSDAWDTTFKPIPLLATLHDTYEKAMLGGRQNDLAVGFGAFTAMLHLGVVVRADSPEPLSIFIPNLGSAHVQRGLLVRGNELEEGFGVLRRRLTFTLPRVAIACGVARPCPSASRAPPYPSTRGRSPVWMGPAHSIGMLSAVTSG
ncbi:hypothetical protein EDB83DRAFT_2318626 [Lactarius deliciosus]|nr:hypothetical protein EDB83DRAFT_2318626 [Lactarius deliciosus]